MEFSDGQYATGVFQGIADATGVDVALVRRQFFEEAVECCRIMESSVVPTQPREGFRMFQWLPRRQPMPNSVVVMVGDLGVARIHYRLPRGRVFVYDIKPFAQMV